MKCNEHRQLVQIYGPLLLSILLLLFLLHNVVVCGLCVCDPFHLLNIFLEKILSPLRVVAKIKNN